MKRRCEAVSLNKQETKLCSCRCLPCHYLFSFPCKPVQMSPLPPATKRDTSSFRRQLVPLEPKNPRNFQTVTIGKLLLLLQQTLGCKMFYFLTLKLTTYDGQQRLLFSSVIFFGVQGVNEQHRRLPIQLPIQKSDAEHITKCDKSFAYTQYSNMRLFPAYFDIKRGFQLFLTIECQNQDRLLCGQLKSRGPQSSNGSCVHSNHVANKAKR